MKKILVLIILIINSLNGNNEKLKSKSCNSQNPEICFSKAHFMHRGSKKNIKKNMNKIIELYKKACIGEYARACHNLGVLYHCHLEELPSIDYKEIIRLYDKACLLNNLLPMTSYLKSDSLSCILSENLKKFKELNDIFPDNNESQTCSKKIHKIIYLFDKKQNHRKP